LFYLAKAMNSGGEKERGGGGTLQKEKGKEGRENLESGAYNLKTISPNPMSREKTTKLKVSLSRTRGNQRQEPFGGAFQ